MLQENGLSVTSTPLKINQLIAGLPAKERLQILRLSEPVDLVFGAVLCEADAALQYAYFPLTSLISLSAITSDHRPLGMAIIGNDGVLGATLALGANSIRLRGVVYGSGAALSLSAPQVRLLLRDSPGLSGAFRRYCDVLMGQTLQTAACNSFHEVEKRLARWLLMTDDRSHSVPFRLTHQFLADLLGVQRSAVTIAAGRLQDKKLIAYVRGKISILSRNGLEAASCECYGAGLDPPVRSFTAVSTDSHH